MRIKLLKPISIVDGTAVIVILAGSIARMPAVLQPEQDHTPPTHISAAWPALINDDDGAREIEWDADAPITDVEVLP